jgi:hypothetical protein
MATVCWWEQLYGVAGGYYTVYVFVLQFYSFMKTEMTRGRK